MLAFAALHCLARASSLPMASFMASPHAEFVLTEPASAESDAPPHVTVFYEKSDDLANLAFDSLSLFYETDSTFSTCPASAAGTPYASSIADSSIGLNVPPTYRRTTGDPILEPPTLSPTTWATSRTCPSSRSSMTTTPSPVASGSEILHGFTSSTPLSDVASTGTRLVPAEATNNVSQIDLVSLTGAPWAFATCASSSNFTAGSPRAGFYIPRLVFDHASTNVDQQRRRTHPPRRSFARHNGGWTIRVGYLNLLDSVGRVLNYNRDDWEACLFTALRVAGDVIMAVFIYICLYCGHCDCHPAAQRL